MMNKYIVPRIALTLIGVGLVVFSLTPNLPTNAQHKDSCEGVGWTPIDGSQVDLRGSWLGSSNRNCEESEKWEYPGFDVEITKEGSVYYGKIGSETKTEIDIEGSKFTWIRDLRGAAGTDPDTKLHNQTWEGHIQRNQEGKIRIYGTWSGAFQALPGKNNYNRDFRLVRK